MAADTIADDLARRDFTINSIATALGRDTRGTVIDPLDGVADIAAGIVRVLHDASFVEDPTRLFRAARYSARYGWSLEPRTRDLALEAVAAGALDTISIDRIRAELELVVEEVATPALDLLHELGVLARISRQVAREWPTQRVLVQAIDHAEGSDDTAHARAWRMRLAAMAIPLGADGARAWTSSLHMRARDTDAVTRHVRAVEIARTQRDLIAVGSMPELRTRLGHTDDESLELAQLDAQVTGDRQLADALHAFRDAVGITNLSVRGHDLLAMGLDRGPAVGEVLEELYDRRLTGEIATTEQEFSAAMELVHRMRDLREPGAQA
jgi:tRNA nucleotidyltransferase (CCA-adding enzyme)